MHLAQHEDQQMSLFKDRQQYGGTSSTGEFAQALQEENSKRTKQTLLRQQQITLNKLYQSATQAENDYQAQVQSLEQQKQAAVLQARQQLNQQLLRLRVRELN